MDDSPHRHLPHPSISLLRRTDVWPASAKAATMDHALIWDLFTNCIQAAELLGVDESLRKEFADARSRLLPYQIGKYGQLQEWFLDFEDQDPQHRHVSHLFGSLSRLSVDRGGDCRSCSKRLSARSNGGAISAPAGASHGKSICGHDSAMATAPCS